MSPEIPSSASSLLGQCVVCGTETDTRCSTCAESGFHWMFFCSTNHQKLIWKAHKLVCGKNPFEWPPLTKEEADEIWELRNSRVTLSPGVTETWLDQYKMNCLRDNVFDDPEHYEELASLSDAEWESFGKEMIGRLQERTDGPMEQEFFRSNRSMAANARVTSFRLSLDARAFSDRAVAYLCSSPLRLFAWFFNNARPISDVSWYSTLLHRFYLFVTVRSLAVRPDTKSRVPANSVQYTTRVVRGFLEDQGGICDSRERDRCEVRRILGTVLPKAVDLFGTMENARHKLYQYF